jgi:hypothetical protein
MTPQEKAIELIDKMYLVVLEQNVKQGALIAVDEISKCTKYEKQKFDNDRFSEQYWQEVKQEIENL